VTPLEFCQDLWHQNTKSLWALYVIVTMTLRQAVWYNSGL